MSHRIELLKVQHAAEVEALKAKLDAAQSALDLIAAEVCVCTESDQACAGCMPEVVAREAVQRINEMERKP